MPSVSLTGDARCRNAARARISSSNMSDNDSCRKIWLRIQERIAAARGTAGRRAEEITLIGVSKTHPAEAIRAAL